MVILMKTISVYWLVVFVQKNLQFTKVQNNHQLQMKSNVHKQNRLMQ